MPKTHVLQANTVSVNKEGGNHLLVADGEEFAFTVRELGQDSKAVNGH